MSGLRLFRLCSLFLFLLLCLANFSVVASAAEAEENLVDGTLSNWVDVNDLHPDYFNDVDTGLSGFGDNWQHVTIFPAYQSAIIYDLSNLSIDTSYKFSFEFQTLHSNLSIFDVFDVHIGVATLDTIGVPTVNTDPHVEYVLTSANYTEFLQTGFTMQFNLSSFVGQPCVYFYFVPKDNANLSQSRAVFHVRNVSLVQVDENSKKLDGILGWLQELWNSIKDGFSNLGGKLSELGSSITDNFNRFWDSISERLDVSEGYLVEIKSFFHDLYWDLVGGTCKYGDEHISLFERLGNRIGGFFDDMKLKIDLKVEEIKTSIHDFFVPPEDFFDNWKTRFNAMLEHNLGFVYQAPNFVVQVVNCIQDVINTKKEPNLVFPKVEFDIVGYHVVLFEDTAVDFSFLDSGIWATVYGMYKVMVHAILSFALIKFAQDTWERMMSN